MSLIREFVRLQTDVTLAQQEMLLGLAAKPLLTKAKVRRGDGRPVILLPGFGANEALLRRLASFLQERCGYVVEIFVPGFPKDESLDDFIDRIGVQLSQRIRELAGRTGHAVSLVGQSAGGLYSREFVLRKPDMVDRVITLGSPTFCPENMHLQNKALTLLIERSFGTSAERTFSAGRYLHWDKHRPQIPYVAIFSPIDGAVRAETVVIPESQLNGSAKGAIRENIAILASHFGMVQNPLVMLAVADRLAADKENWQAFEPMDYFPEAMGRISSIAYPAIELDKMNMPVMDLHPHQLRGRDARERVINTLRTEHRNIGRLLQTVREEIGARNRRRGRVPDYTVIAGVVDYLGNYTDGFHHPREDLMFERLLQHKPELARPVEHLTREHKEIEPEVQALEAHLQRHLHGTRPGSRNKSLDAHCLRYASRLGRHLEFEEREVFPHAQVLTRRDWSAVDKGHAQEPDPLFGEVVQERYEALADALASRVEGISETAAMQGVASLGATASSVQVLGAALTDLRKQQIEQLRAAGATQRKLLIEALKERSAWALAKLPARLTVANVALARRNTAANLESIRRVAKEIADAWRQGGEAP